MQAALAIVVPADVYRRNPGDGEALMKARLWEGSVVYQGPDAHLGYQSSDGGRGGGNPAAKPYVTAPASIENLVGQFLNLAKRPRSHFPLCAASVAPILWPVPGRNHFPGPSGTCRNRRARPAGPRCEEFEGRRGHQDGRLAGDRPARGNGQLGQICLRPERIGLQDIRRRQAAKARQDHNHGSAVQHGLHARHFCQHGFQFADTGSAALRFLDKLHRDDRIMIVSFNDRIFLHTELTASLKGSGRPLWR